MLYQNATKLYMNPSQQLNDNICNWWSSSIPKASDVWTDLNILRFLRLYQTHTLLWDTTHAYYKNRRARTAAYRKIAKTLRLKNVDEVECMKLVELLKKRYVEEKKFNRDDKVPKPAWFCIISGIVGRILNVEKKAADQPQTSASFEACEGCCAKQNLTAPCCYYHEPSDGTSANSSQVCRDCCNKQNLTSPCRYYQGSSRQSSSYSSQACRDCCTKQNFQPPCEHYKNPRGSLAETKQQDHRQPIESNTVKKDDLKIVVLDFQPCFAPEARKNDCDEANPCCDCLASSESAASATTSCDNDKSSCSGNSSKTSSENSKSTLNNFRVQDFVACHYPFARRATCCDDAAMVKQSEEETLIASQLNDDVVGGGGSGDDNEKAGLFMDSSQQFRGKRINLIDLCKRIDEFGDEKEEIVRVRRHFAAYAPAIDDYDDDGSVIQDKWYPLQVEM